MKGKDSCVQRLHENTLAAGLAEKPLPVLPVECGILEDTEQSTLAKTQSGSKLTGLQARCLQRPVSFRFGSSLACNNGISARLHDFFLPYGAIILPPAVILVLPWLRL